MPGSFEHINVQQIMNMARGKLKDKQSPEPATSPISIGTNDEVKRKVAQAEAYGKEEIQRARAALSRLREETDDLVLFGALCMIWSVVVEEAYIQDYIEPLVVGSPIEEMDKDDYNMERLNLFKMLIAKYVDQIN